jgi:hypothetical protein
MHRCGANPHRMIFIGYGVHKLSRLCKYTSITSSYVHLLDIHRYGSAPESHQVDMPEGQKQHRTFHVNMHVVGKKNGSLRLCEDYQRVNAVTNDDLYPMESMTLLKTLAKPGTSQRRDGIHLHTWQISIPSHALKTEGCPNYFPASDGRGT